MPDYDEMSIAELEAYRQQEKASMDASRANHRAAGMALETARTNTRKAKALTKFQAAQDELKAAHDEEQANG